MTDTPKAPVAYPREAVLTLEQLAAALQVGTDRAAAMDLPFFMAGRSQRFIWGVCLDILAERALKLGKAA